MKSAFFPPMTKNYVWDKKSWVDFFPKINNGPLDVKAVNVKIHKLSLQVVT